MPDCQTIWFGNLVKVRARGAAADILVTTNGASVGDYDLVQPALPSKGMQARLLEGRGAGPGRPLMDGHPGLRLRRPLLAPLIRRLTGQIPAEDCRLGCRVDVRGAADDERAGYLQVPLERDLTAQDPRGQTLIAAVLADFARLARGMT